MSTKKEVREFLISRRANVTPGQGGLIRYGEDRCVPGLRRREVAQLAGVSLNYYSRLERGYIRGASESVLNAVAEALHLSEEERKHLFDLARTAPALRTTTQPVLRTSQCSSAGKGPFDVE